MVGSGGSLEDTLISHSNVILCESCTLNSGRFCLKVITLESPLPLIVETTLASEFEPRMKPDPVKFIGMHNFVSPFETDVASNSVKRSELDD